MNKDQKKRLTLSIILSATAAIIILGSCLSPEARTFLSIATPLIVPISQAAEDSGHLPPGSTVTIQKGQAIITSADSQETKLMALKTLGVETALNEGLIQEGDKLLVDHAGTALVKIITAAEAAKQEAERQKSESPPSP